MECCDHRKNPRIRLRDWLLARCGSIGQHVGVGLEDNKALVRRYYEEVLTGRDRGLLAQLLDPSFVSHVSGGPVVGIGVYTAAVEATHGAFADLVVTVEDQVAERDRVTTRWRASGTHTGSFAGVAATVEHWEELDQLGLLRQMGVLG